MKEVKMKSTKEKIEVMNASLNGNCIQKYINGWVDVYLTNPEPEWDWKNYDYRIKPQEPQIDWSKVKVGTSILVRNEETEDWKEAVFLKFSDCITFKFVACVITDNEINSFRYCKLDKSAPSIINWIKNTGERPENKELLIMFDGGNIGHHYCSDDLDFSIGNNIKEYAIIE